MSLSNVLQGPIQQWANVFFNNVYCNSINGQPVPAGFDSNPANIIYRQGSTPPAGSNIVSTWHDVVVKAQQLNVNECLNVYIDSSIVNPCDIDESLDCKGRVRLLGNSRNAGSGFSNAVILDGVVLTDPGEISGTLGIACQSITGPNIAMSSGGILIAREGANLTNTLTSLVPSIQVADGQQMIFSSGLGGQMGTSVPGVALINVGVGSTLIYTNVMNSAGQVFPQGSFSSTDNSATLIVIGDASFDLTQVINPAFTSTNVIKQTIDKALNVEYNDNTQAPPSGSSTVQGVIDWLKTQIGGGGGSPNTNLIYRPGGVSSGNVYSTWAQICTVSGSLNNLVNIYFDNSIISPCSINQSYDFTGNASFYPFIEPANQRISVQIEDGILIKNVKSMIGQLEVLCDNISGTPSLEWDVGTPFLNLSLATLDNTANSTDSYINVPSLLRIGMNYNAQVLASNGAQKAITLQPGSTLFISSNFGSILGSDIIYSVDGTSNFTYYADASQNGQVQNNFTGTSLLTKADNSLYVEYNDNVILPPLSADNVQGAIDQIKTKFNALAASQVNLVYKVGAGNSGNVYGTWGDIITASLQNDNFVNIYFDNTLFTCYIDQSHDFQNKANFYGMKGTTDVDIYNGVTIRNLKSINDDLRLRCNNDPAASSCLEWDTNSIFTMTSGSTIESTDCIVPPIIMLTGDILTFNMYNSELRRGNNTVVAVANGAIFNMLMFDNCYVDNDVFVSLHPTASITANYESNTDVDFNNQPGFAGSTIFENKLDKSIKVDYDDLLVAPTLNTTTVQGAIDVLKTTSPLATQAKFRAIVNPNLTNVTGNGGTYVVKFQSTVYDNFTGYDPITGFYTIPVNGYYLIQSNLLLTNIVTATQVDYGIVTNSSPTTLYDRDRFDPANVITSGSVTTRLSTMLYLTAGSSVACSLIVGGEAAATVGISGGALLPYSFFAVTQIP